MKKLLLSFLLLTVVFSIYASLISQDVARKAALNYLMHYSKLKSGVIDLSYGNINSYEGTVTFYTFSIDRGGWIIISADDAATPVLAYSTSGTWDEETINPTAKKWIESYNKEIYEAVQSNKTVSASQTEWQTLLDLQFSDAIKTVSPLTTTSWDQSRYYNDLCPASSSALSGYGGHVPTGCVATTMAQIMKYYNYPAQGIGSFSYTHPAYSTLSANFGSTDYNWSSMPDKATSTNAALATLMYHCGVSVSMDYNPNGSGASSEMVSYAMKTYFNYDNGIHILSREKMPSDECGELLFAMSLMLTDLFITQDPDLPEVMLLFAMVTMVQILQNSISTGDGVAIATAIML